LKPDPVRLAIAGAGGRMGRMLLAQAALRPGVRVASAFEAPGHDAVGADAASLAGMPGLAGIRVVDDAAEAISAAEVLIEFTLPAPSLEHLRVAADVGRGVVLGTTGFTAAEQEEIDRLAKRIPLLQASNMSVGVTVLAEIVEEVARRLGAGFDIEVVETHHRHKRDAPSGTALTLARAAAIGRGANLESWAIHGRSGIVGERPDEQIGILALRGGDVVGDHTVAFYGTGERLELTHRAHSREAFASGALRAAEWLSGRAPGRYSIRDALHPA
jgi:4-hydroxy-tetrahydrodipicolinate reductase